jgi:acyl-CoA synthetase (AMP-forming)/AMP-acid ligase II
VVLHEVITHAPPDAPALITGGRVTSFGELVDRVRRTATWVAAVSDPGDRIGIVGDNHPVWVDAYYGVPGAGRILVFLNHRLAAPELRSIAARAGLRVLIGASEHVGRLSLELPTVTFDDWEDEVQAFEPAGQLASDASAPAWIIYTSGTTAQPKGAVLTHAAILASVAVTAAARPATDDDVYIFPFPLCHVAGYNLVHHHQRGRPVVLLPRFDAAAFVEAVARHGVTSTSVAATMLTSLLDLAEADPAAQAALAAMRLIGYGAAPMPAATLRRASRLLDVGFAQGYGMTELAGNAVFLGPDEHRRGLAGEPHLLTAAGRPGPGVEVRVVDDAGRDQPPGRPGEILVRGAQVLAGYWGDDGATAEAFDGEWLRTGDVGRWDDEGFLYIVDRKKDVIVTGGENVSSLEVEQVLAACPGVREVAVVGVPDARWGENVCAVVASVPGTIVDRAALVGAARAVLAGFKVPRHVVFVDELPKNGTGKIVKAELRRWLAADPSLLEVRR